MKYHKSFPVPDEILGFTGRSEILCAGSFLSVSLRGNVLQCPVGFLQ